MSVERINSLIKTYFSDTLMRELERVFYAKSFIEYPKKIFEAFKGNFRSKDLGDKVRVLILHNNDRINLYKALINLHWNRPVNFGTGTNRMAVIVDSYVFKIAMDHAGCVDNLHEFIMSSELQPFVTKCYETNELISVSEYVNVMSDKAQFENRKDEIMDILRELEASTSLMLDVGFIPKNMTNWGVRPSDNKAVILDYGYLYTDLEGISLTCADQTCIKKFGISRLVYTDAYSHMQCPNCGKEVTVLELQSLITTEARSRMYDSKMENAFKVTKPVTYFKVDEFGDYVEMEEADDSMLVSKRKRRENIEEVMEKYKEVCADYHAQLITLGEPSDLIQQQKETLRRMILELKYDKDYGDMDLETQLEEPYEQEELNMNRMVDLNDDPIDRLVYEAIDKDINRSTRERVKQEIEDEDTDDIKASFMSYNERDKILSKLLVSRGEKPLVDLYEDEDETEETEDYNYSSYNRKEEVFTPIYEKKPEPKKTTVQDFNKNFGGIEIQLGYEEDDEDILDETSKFIESISNGGKASDVLAETSFEEVEIITDEVETTDGIVEITNVVLEKPGVEIEATVTNDVNAIVDVNQDEETLAEIEIVTEDNTPVEFNEPIEVIGDESQYGPEREIEVELSKDEVEVETDETIMELDDSMLNLMESDDYAEVISCSAEVSEEVTFVANSYESESVTELAEKIIEKFEPIQEAFIIPEPEEVIRCSAEVSEGDCIKVGEPKDEVTNEKVTKIEISEPEVVQTSFDDLDDIDLNTISQELFNDDDDIESFDNDSFVQNVVRSEDEDLDDRYQDVISTKHVEEKVKKVEHDDYDFDDDDEFDEIYEQNHRERSMKSTRKSFK